jgi:hypothetical protein
MNWDAIAAVGEILGALAVLATLAYLSVQVSQNTKELSENAKALRRSELNALMQNWSDLRRIEMTDPSLVEILVRAALYFSGRTTAERREHRRIVVPEAPATALACAAL